MKKIPKRILLYGLGGMMSLAVLGALVLAVILWRVTSELPSYEHLADYAPRIMSRVHAADGELIAEFAEERRIFVPIGTIPNGLIEAFLSSEDKNFYEHSGIDMMGIARAMISNVANVIQGRRLEGASTITQQVAKNFLLSSDVTLERKLKEAIMAMRLERAFTKRDLLELYLNEIYLGLGSYGVAEASLRYFGKSLSDLTTSEMAYLAALPKAPNNYHPFRREARAIARRNWVIDRMAANGFISTVAAENAKASDLGVIDRPAGVRIAAANHFVEEVRRQTYDLFGQNAIYSGGLSIRTTLDARFQIIALKALRDGLQAYDKRKGYRGPIAKLESLDGWREALRAYSLPYDVKDWDIAVVLEVAEDSATIGLRPRKLLSGKLEPIVRYGKIALDELVWAREAPDPERNNYRIMGPKITRATQVLDVGDVIHVEATAAPYIHAEREAQAREYFEALFAAGADNGGMNPEVTPDFQPTPAAYFEIVSDFPYRLQQMPEIEGALVAMDPHTGRVKAMVGGYSFKSSEFNRAVQALRQPGSAFKPFVYAAALDNGYTPASLVLDAPFVMEQGEGDELWKPENYGRRFHGASTLRLGIEKSRNLMTIRMAQQLGMRKVMDYTRRFDITDNATANLSLALGSGETTLMRLTRAYAVLVNGGRDVQPVFIDRIQNRKGQTVFRSDARACDGCVAEAWFAQLAPQLMDTRDEVLTPQTAYQIVSMLEGVVQRGTATFISRIGKPLAGKTGTTNDSRDAWFVGFSPDLVVGVFVGFDDNRPLGKGESGGGVAAPVFYDFMRNVLQDAPSTPFRIPDGLNLVRINAKTGKLASAGDEQVILEAFKPGTAPGDTPALSADDDPGFAAPPQMEDDSGLGEGTGGLY